MKDMKEIRRRGFALILAIMMIVSSAVMLAACGSSSESGESESSSGSEVSEESGSENGTEAEAGTEDDDTDEEEDIEHVEDGSGVTDEELEESENSAFGGKKYNKNDYNTKTAFVAGKCYVFSKMSGEGEEFDDELIKDMFDIKDVTDYMMIYFKKGGNAYVKSVLYGKDVQEGKWGEDKDGFTLLQVGDDGYVFKKHKNGTITTLTEEEDGDEFLITFREAKKTPKALKKYVK